MIAVEGRSPEPATGQRVYSSRPLMSQLGRELDGSLPGSYCKSE
jgi:hypothetical protein